LHVSADAQFEGKRSYPSATKDGERWKFIAAASSSEVGAERCQILGRHVEDEIPLAEPARETKRFSSRPRTLEN
jgi:hypothetical protein